MKATDTFEEGYIGVSSGYFWSGLIYNLSVSVSLYSLAFFWICLHQDLKPFRPIPKFLTVKLIIFASYWQGFFLAILDYFNVIPGVGSYTPDNLARAIQDFLICIEMPLFAVAHWYAFSYRDFQANIRTSCRLPIKDAVRDAAGCRDLWCDIKMSLRGEGYGYRAFETREVDRGMHVEGEPRMARIREGLRYEKGGQSKYWIPMPDPSRGPLLSPSSEHRSSSTGGGYGAVEHSAGPSRYSYWEVSEPLTMDIDAEDERIYQRARALEFGDYNVKGRLIFVFFHLLT